uniref:putative nuclease HARBI1 n=1 Tax=Myxine glutinosa TaxID=7769 RepID=UPI00359005CE
MDALGVLELAQEEAEEHRSRTVRRRALRIFEDRCNPLEKYDDIKFVWRYRLSKESFRWLLDLVKDDLDQPTMRSNALNPLQQLSVALRFYASASFQLDVGDMGGVSQATCCKVIHRVTAAICAKKTHFIHFPDTPEERRTVTQGFHEISRFPGVIGAVDGSHVAIVNPGGRNALRYMNRDGYYSLNSQLVCDHRLLFTNVVARWYGSAHDSRIFEESQLFEKFQRGEYRGILLGDPAYTCRTFMLTPVRIPKTPAERRYNHAKRSTRRVIERALDIWKERFSCVAKGNHLRCTLEHNMAIIVATVCLHNLAKRRNDPLPEPDHDIPHENLPEPNQRPNRVEADLHGNIFRQRFIMEHFNQQDNSSVVFSSTGVTC